jgi:hypothetical protein
MQRLVRRMPFIHNRLQASMAFSIVFYALRPRTASSPSPSLQNTHKTLPVISRGLGPPLQPLSCLNISKRPTANLHFSYSSNYVIAGIASNIELLRPVCRGQSTVEQAAWRAIGTETEAERQELSGKNHMHLPRIPSPRILDRSRPPGKPRKMGSQSTPSWTIAVPSTAVPA